MDANEDNLFFISPGKIVQEWDDIKNATFYRQCMGFVFA